ncbi:MAG: hypothetical protein OXG65_15740 [Chloroflexi bacterium]|nr:hypothetical protein [Chloroflexota bacterium]
MAADHSLNEHYQEVLASGSESATGFISGLKGKLAELLAQDLLEQNGYTEVKLAADPTQAVWDISAVDQAGEQHLFQVKTGAESYSHELVEALESQPDLHFLVGSELYSKVVASSPELAGRITDIGSDEKLVETVQGSLSSLDSAAYSELFHVVGESAPPLFLLYSLGRLALAAKKTRNEFEGLDFAESARVQLVQNSPLVAQLAGSAVLASLGALIGSSVGPGGTVAGIAIGIGLARQVSRPLETQTRKLARRLTNTAPEDVFYLRHKEHLDDLAVRFQKNARQAMAMD